MNSDRLGTHSGDALHCEALALLSATGAVALSAGGWFMVEMAASWAAYPLAGGLFVVAGGLAHRFWQYLDAAQGRMGHEWWE